MKKIKNVLLLTFLAIFVAVTAVIFKGFEEPDPSLPKLPEVTQYPSLTPLPDIAPTGADYRPFKETISLDRGESQSETSISFTSLIPQDSEVREETGVVTPDGTFGQRIVVEGTGAKIVLETNPYDVGGPWTANDYQYFEVQNKLNMHILRAETEPDRYIYAQFKQGECEYDVQVPITPVGSNLSCGVPWLSIGTASRSDSYEIVLIDCYVSTAKGLEQCDRFVEELEIAISP